MASVRQTHLCHRASPLPPFAWTRIHWAAFVLKICYIGNCAFLERYVLHLSGHLKESWEIFSDDLFKLIMIFTVTDNLVGVKRYKSSILDYWGTELVYFCSRIVLSWSRLRHRGWRCLIGGHFQKGMSGEGKICNAETAEAFVIFKRSGTFAFPLIKEALLKPILQCCNVVWLHLYNLEYFIYHAKLTH